MTSDSTVGLKVLTSFMAGIIITGLGAFLAYPHNLPTRDDLVQSQLTTQKQIDSMQSQINQEQDQLTNIRVMMGKMAEKLQIPDGQ